MALLNFQQNGNGEDIVLIHGLFGSLENLNMVAKTLKTQFRVTSVDVRNHGSSFHQNNMAYSVLAEDILALLNHLNIDKCHLLGHSMGGKIAMQVALNFPEKVNKLIVADIAPVKYPAHHQTIIDGLQAIDLSICKSRKDADKQLSHHVESASIRQFLLRNLAVDDKQALYFKCSLNDIAAGYEQIMQGMDEAQRFTGDTLFVKGGKSDYILAEHQTIIQQLFPNSRAKIIANAGHWLHAEKPAAFNKIALDFLNN